MAKYNYTNLYELLELVKNAFLFNPGIVLKVKKKRIAQQ